MSPSLLQLAAAAGLALLSGGAAAQPAAFQPGTYRCMASKLSNGTLEMKPRGAVVFAAGGKYSYKGFAQPSEGTWKAGAGGKLELQGGYLAGGEATPIQGYANRYHLVFPTNPDSRWSCSRAD
ncbi:MAG: hypothetical protein EOO24_36545 [Comamonadaceae bacterium]|nr:MAG: hypothetical protein EOO24_36545 [Comamonadaceae bacterium]